jgi:hypothetical protein
MLLLRCIGNLSHHFYDPSYTVGPGQMSISFLLDQNPNVASVGFGGALVERAE